MSETKNFVCKARRLGSAGGNDPVDCDWPFCGCDPYANRVMEAINESGYKISRDLIQCENHLRAINGQMPIEH